METGGGSGKAGVVADQQSRLSSPLSSVVCRMQPVAIDCNRAGVSRSVATATTSDFSLTHLTRLHGLTRLPGLTRLTSPTRLTSLTRLPGLTRLTRLTRLLGLTRLPSLTRLPGLTRLTRLTRLLGLTRLPSLTRLPGLTRWRRSRRPHLKQPGVPENCLNARRTSAEEFEHSFRIDSAA